MEGFASSGGDVGIQFLVSFSHGVEEAPDVTTSEFPVGGFPPFLEDFRDLSGGDSSAVEGADDEVVRFVVGDALLFVGVDALIEFYETVTEFPDGSAGKVAEVSLSETGVLSAQFNLASEREVITNEDLGSGHHGGGESLIM